MMMLNQVSQTQEHKYHVFSPICTTWVYFYMHLCRTWRQKTDWEKRKRSKAVVTRWQVWEYIHGSRSRECLMQKVGQQGGLKGGNAVVTFIRKHTHAQCSMKPITTANQTYLNFNKQTIEDRRKEKKKKEFDTLVSNQLWIKDALQWFPAASLFFREWMCLLMVHALYSSFSMAPLTNYCPPPCLHYCQNCHSSYIFCFEFCFFEIHIQNYKKFSLYVYSILYIRISEYFSAVLCV